MNTRQVRCAYGQSLRTAGVSDGFIEAFLGEDAFRNVLFTPFFAEAPPTPWPPCFIPLLKPELGIEAYGAILHPFHPERPLSFAQLEIEGGYFREVARSEAQFLALITLTSSISYDEEVVLDDDALRLLNRLGHENLAPAILEAASQTGIVEEGLSRHVPAFMTDWPLDLYEYRALDAYTGGFPTTLTSSPSCAYERNFLSAAALVSSAAEEGLERIPDADQLANAPGDAWMALQAPSVTIETARQVLESLRAHTAHPLPGAWLQAAQDLNLKYNY